MKKFLLILLSFFFASFCFAQKADLVLQTGHTGAVKSISFSPDGKYFVSSDSKTIKLFEVNTGKELRTICGFSNLVSTAVFSEDGKYIAAAVMEKDFSYSLYIWESATGKQYKSFGKEPVSTEVVLFSKDGKNLITGGWDNKIKIWNIEKGEVIKEFVGHESIISCIDLSSDGKKIVSGSWDKTIKLWDVESGALLKTFSGHRMELTNVHLSPDNKIIVSSSKDSTVRVWDTETGKALYTNNSPKGTFLSSAISPDGKTYAGCCWDNSIHLWAIATGKELLEIKGSMLPFYSVVYNHDGKIIAGGSYTYIKFYDPSSGAEIKSFNGHMNMIKGISVSADGKYIASAGSEGMVKIWDFATGKRINSYTNYSSNAASMNFSPDSKFIACANIYDIRLINILSGKEVDFTTGHTLPITGIGFSPDGKYIASASMDKTIKLFDIGTQKLIRTFSGIEALIATPVFSPDGKYIATPDINFVKVWETSSGKLLPIFTEFEVVINAVSFSPDGKYLIGASSQNISNVWEFPSGKKVKVLTGHGWEVKSANFSPDNKFIVSGSSDQTIIQYDAETGKEINRLLGHTDRVNSVVFSPDNKYIVSGSDDGTFKIWDRKKGELITTFTTAGDEFVISTPDNYYYISRYGYDLVSFRVGNHAYPFEQFDLKYNRPDIVLNRIGYAPKEVIDAYKNAYKKRMKKLGFSENMFNDDFHLPVINLMNMASLPPTATDKFVTLKIKATDSKYKLDRINIWINDVPIYGENGVSVASLMKDSIVKDFKVELANSLNKIQVSCINDKGVESFKETTQIRYENKTASKPNLYLIVMSVSDYKDSRYKLGYASKDGHDLVRLFTSNKTSYSNIFVDTLFDNRATKENFATIKTKLSAANVDDQIILFVSGHGLLDDSLDFYYASYDCDFNKPALRGISYYSIENLLDNIPPRKKLLMIDACHSGEVDKDELKVDDNNSNVTLADGSRGGLKTYSYRGIGIIDDGENHIGLSNSFELMQDLFTNLNRGSGAIVISAAAGKGYALESPEWNNGVFTYAVQSGLMKKAADLDKNGTITVAELKNYVIHEVETLTKGAQKPTSRKDNLNIDYVIW